MLGRYFTKESKDFFKKTSKIAVLFLLIILTLFSPDSTKAGSDYSLEEPGIFEKGLFYVGSIGNGVIKFYTIQGAITYESIKQIPFIGEGVVELYELAGESVYVGTKNTIETYKNYVSDFSSDEGSFFDSLKQFANKSLDYVIENGSSVHFVSQTIKIKLPEGIAKVFAGQDLSSPVPVIGIFDDEVKETRITFRTVMMPDLPLAYVSIPRFTSSDSSPPNISFSKDSLSFVKSPTQIVDGFFVLQEHVLDTTKLMTGSVLGVFDGFKNQFFANINYLNPANVDSAAILEVPTKGANIVFEKVSDFGRTFVGNISKNLGFISNGLNSFALNVAEGTKKVFNVDLLTSRSGLDRSGQANVFSGMVDTFVTGTKEAVCTVRGWIGFDCGKNKTQVAQNVGQSADQNNIFVADRNQEREGVQVNPVEIIREREIVRETVASPTTIINQNRLANTNGSYITYDQLEQRLSVFEQGLDKIDSEGNGRSIVRVTENYHNVSDSIYDRFDDLDPSTLTVSGQTTLNGTTTLKDAVNVTDEFLLDGLYGSSGEVLTSQGTGTTPIWSTISGTLAIGSSVTSATAGSVLFVDSSGNLAQDNSSFYFDNTNNFLGIGTTSPYAKLSVAGETVAEVFTATSTTGTSTLPNLSVTQLLINGEYVTDLTGTNLSITNGVLNASGGGGGTFAWTPTTNYGEAVSATTTALWIQENLYASSTIYAPIFESTSLTATSTLPNISATQILIGGDYITDFVGTGLSNSSGVLTLNATGDWTGTFDGQEGSYYLDASNLTNFGTPFYTFFNATNTDALSEGSSNLYWTNDRFDGRLSATTTLPGLTTLTGLTTVGTIGTGVWQGTAVADTYVANDLTISGGTINSTPIGASSASTAVFTNATATNATTTGDFYVSSEFGLNSEYFTDLTGTGLSNSSGVLTLNATGDWTGTFDGQEGSYYLDTDNLSSGTYTNMITSFDASGNLVATSTPSFAAIFATSTTATSTFSAPISIDTKSSGQNARLILEANNADSWISFYEQTGDQYYSVGIDNTLDNFIIHPESSITGSSGLTVDSSGRVGIGDNTPGVELDVNGVAQAERFVADSTTATSTFAGGLTVDTTDLVVDPDGGFVGIGTNPSSKLHVYQNSPTADQILFQIGTSNNATEFSIDEDGDVTMTGSLRWPGSYGFDSAGQTITTNTVKGFTTNSSLLLQNHNFTSAGNMLNLSSGTFSNSSGDGVAVRILPTYNQTGTAGGTDLLINRTETAIGSGSHYLIDAQVGGTSMFNVGSNGNIGVGTTSPYAKLSVAGQTVAEYFTATSTTGTSTFAGVLSVGTSTPDGSALFEVGTSSPLLFVDKDSGNIGIGNTTATRSLEVRGTGIRLSSTDLTDIADIYLQTSGILTFDNTLGNGGYLDFRSDDNNYGMIIRESDGTGTATFANLYVVDNGSNDYLSININSASDGDALVIAESNNIGVGTTSPYAKLSVAGETVAEVFTATSTTGTSTLPNLSVTQLLINGEYVTDLTGTNLSITNGVLNASGGGGGTFAWTPTTNYGEAVSATTTALWIQENLYASSTIYAPIFTAASTTATSTFAGGLDVLAINQTGTATSTFSNGIELAGGCYRDATGSCITSGLWSQNGSEIYYNTANVGINTTDPKSELDVGGDIWLTNATQGNIHSRDTAGTNYRDLALVASDFYIYTATTNNGNSSAKRLSILDTSGYVGIGNITPTYDLQVDGDARFAGLVDANYFVATSSSATSTFAGVLSVGTSTPDGSVLFEVGTTTPLVTVNNSSGYTGFMNASPLAPIHVGGASTNNSSDAVVLISRNVDDATSGNGHAFSDSSQITRSGTVGYNSFDGRININGSNDFDHYAAFQSAPTYNSSGTMTNNYGLYTTVDVDQGTITNNYGVYAANPTGAGAITNNYGLYSEGQTAGTNDWGLYIDGTVQSYFGGRVGIGDSTPRAPLEISATPVTWAGNLMLKHPSASGDSAFAYITAWDSTENGSGTTGRLWWIGNGSTSNSDLLVSTDASGSDIAFWPSGAETVRFESNGNVGVGTTTPNNLLQLYGGGGPQLLLSDSNGGTDLKHFYASSTLGSLAFGELDDGLTTYTERLRIDASGNVGIGTTSPYALLSVSGQSAADYFEAYATTSTSTFAGGINAGSGSFVHDSYTGVTSIDALELGTFSFEEDAGTVTWTDLPVSSTPASGTVQSYTAQINSESILTIYAQADGSGGLLDNTIGVGIGTTVPARMLHVATSSDGAPVRFEDANGYCEIDPTTTTWSCTSDQRLKKNINSLTMASLADLQLSGTTTSTTATSSLERILQLRPVTFNWTNEDSSKDKKIGLIAQEVEQIFPDLVNTGPSSGTEEGLKSVAYGGFTTYIIAAIQELANKVVQLENTVNTLASQISVGGVATTAGNVFGNLTVGTSQKPSGITLYDEKTGNPYCLSISGGNVKTRDGSCDDPNKGKQQSTTYNTNTGSGSGSNTQSSGSTNTGTGSGSTSTTTATSTSSTTNTGSGSGSTSTTTPSSTGSTNTSTTTPPTTSNTNTNTGTGSGTTSTTTTTTTSSGSIPTSSSNPAPTPTSTTAPSTSTTTDPNASGGN